MFFSRLIALTLIAIILSACAPMIDTHGDSLDADNLASLEIGKTSYLEVKKIFGSPSAKTVLDAENWIYIHSQQERVAFFKPKETKRTLVLFKFDRDGILQDIETKTLADGRHIMIDPQTTTIRENSLTILDQMIGNVGRMGTDAPVY